MIRALLFDLGDTLVSLDERRLRKKLKPFLSSLGISWHDFHFYRRSAYLLYSAGRISSDQEFVKLISFGLGLKKPLPLEIVRIYLDCIAFDRKNLRLLKELKKRYRLAILSNNVRSWVDYGIERFGLKGIFDALIISSDVKERKPHPAIYQAALRSLGLSGKECLFISNSLNQDLAMAKLFGMRTVWLRAEGEEKLFEPDFEIRELGEIISVVKRLEIE
jgi:HAD superfamily hydrolase (TIGR01509 family)